MASVASRAQSLPRLRSIPIPARVGVAVFLGLLVAFSLYLRTRALGASLWMDEGLSIGIASQPFHEIPTVLRQDGSPPLYYLLLHVWMSIFGRGPADTQGLSVAIALLAVPSGLWAGWSLFGRRAGMICAALAAFNPFLTNYAQETRMYSLMALLSLLVLATFLHVYVYRDRRYLAPFAVVLAAILYTHSWGIFVTMGTLVALLPLLYRSEGDERKPLVKDTLIGFGAAFILYLPWIPTLLYQTAHTGAPWLDPPRFGVAIQLAKGILGGGTVTVALLLAAGSGAAAVVATKNQSRERTGIITIITMGIATLAIAWLFSQISPAWTTRYLGVAVGPLLLLSAVGLARAKHLGLVALVIVLGIWAIPHTSGLENKSNAADIGTATKDKLARGDLVVTLQPEQAPLMDYTLRPGLDEATQLGHVQTQGVMDWRDAMTRLRAATPAKNLTPLLDSLPVSRRVLMVSPVTTNIGDWDAPWTQLVRRRAAQWGQAIEADPRFKKDESVPAFYRRAGRIGVRGVLYTKVRN